MKASSSSIIVLAAAFVGCFSTTWAWSPVRHGRLPSPTTRSSSSREKNILFKTTLFATLDDQTTLVSFATGDNDDDNNDNNNMVTTTTVAANATAATQTINDRLLKEVEEQLGTGGGGGRNPRVQAFYKSLGIEDRMNKTPEEREAALEAARDLNGVNPLVAFGGALFALGGAYGLWLGTGMLAEFFVMHPVDTVDAPYFVQRASAVVRNVAMGMSSLASGFFGVTGVGLLLLSVRVGYGVLTGELDPTPFTPKKVLMENYLEENNDNNLDLSNVWDLMMGGTGRRRRRRK
mmetsp:Transcript_23281/g.35750  ORF Transcript_23281/g.35750 Transcript_23281/m.35750 type:complete len:291 (+) Transcript_23281:58-930(+)